MKLLLLLLFIPCFSFSQQVYDVIIRNGKIIDGTGNSWYYADVAVKDGKIALIQQHISSTATKIIDAKGLIVAPGFIDVHGHIEGSIFERPTADNYIYDGVTTVVTGNCGGSADDLQHFFFRIDSMHTSINVASLMGHNNVRRIVMGLNNRLATAEEQKQMEALVAKAMKEGAVGLSTGLIYLPGMYSNTDEVIGLAKETAKFYGIYASHIRNEENGVVDAINEAINIGRSANIPVQISHFKLSGPANWGRSAETLSLIETARKQGYDVTIDQYPYTASSTNLGVRLPDWALAGGADSLKKRINDPVLHKQMINEMLVQLKKYKYKNYSFAVVANHAADSTLNGKSITEINKLKGRKSKPREEAETILELMLAGGAQMVYHSMSEKDVQFFMKYPYNMVGADAGVATGKGMPHPRAYGTNSRVLGRYVREQQIISLEEAVRRMTSLPAQKFQLKDRGLLKEGMAADIVLFNEAEVIDNATFENPHQFSTGFKYVIVNGQLVIDAGKHSGTRSGRALFGPSHREKLALEEKKKAENYLPDEKQVKVYYQKDMPMGSILLKNARIISMKGEEVIENGDVLIVNNRIKAVGKTGTLSPPAGTKEVDCTGKTITPGFVDTHAHMWTYWGLHKNTSWIYAANLAYGVTTTRDPQTATTDVLTWGDMVDAGQLPGPRIYSTGPGVGFWMYNLKDLEQTKNVLKQYSKYYNTQYIKMYLVGNRQMRQWVIMAAKEQKLMPTTEGGLDFKLNMTQLFDGYPGHEHAIPIFPLYNDLTRTIAESKMAYTPTLLVAYGGPWAENFYYTTESPLKDPKLNRFTPYEELNAKARRRAVWVDGLHRKIMCFQNMLKV